MALSLAEAAEATGLNRSTILRAIKSGKISGGKDDFGQWSVEPAELFRVFTPAEAAPKAVHQDAQGDAELRVRAAVAEERLAELKQALADMRAQRDSWQAQAERLAIAAQARPSSVPTVQQRPRRWWQRRAG
jgi:hypothetical protein